MAKAINMPKMGNTVESVIVGEIFIKVGDKITIGQKLFNYETDKSTTDYKSEIAGEVLQILMGSGDEIEVLKPIIIVGNKGDDISEWAKSEDKTKTSGASKPENKETPKPQENSLKEDPENHGKVELNNEEEITTKGKISWRARNVAKNLNADLNQVTGSGIRGRIVEKDILSFVHNGSSKSNKNQRPDIESKVVAYSPIRKAISKAMSNSLREAPQLTLGATFDATEILKLRKKIKANHKTMGIANSSINDIFIFALSRVLPKFPHLNAQLISSPDEVSSTRQHYIAHISVAVDTPSGLFVPVVKDASLLSLSDISTKTKELVVKAKNGKLTPKDSSGGTFTISNIGLSGVQFFTPILNYPQVAILGVGTPQTRLRFNANNNVEQYQEITLSLTMDHGPNDGVAGAMFLKELVKILENITILFL